MLELARTKADEKGFSNVQDFIKETLRENLYDDISKKELVLVKNLLAASEEQNLWGTEKELFAKLRRK